MGLVLVFYTTVDAKPYAVIFNTNKACFYDYDYDDDKENFCDATHQKMYIKFPKKVNFDNDKILILPKKNKFDTIYILDPKLNRVYPVPYGITWQDITFNKNSNKFCFSGSITAYQDEHKGKFCFTFKNEDFDREIIEEQE